MATESIAIIGPMGVGKTTVSRKIAQALGLHYIDVDELRWDYFSQQPDFDHQVTKTLYESGNAAGAFQYMKPFEAGYVEAIVEKYSAAVLDFGAGYTVYTDQALFGRVQACFKPFGHVVFLRYSPDPKESLEALQHRHAEAPAELFKMLNREFIESPCNGILATCIVDTKDKTADEVAKEVIKRVSS
ncbi:MAG TPA: shikimate kinase [Candidatus Limiplasma sp.]|nr:shikimate kinase [Candidatus Limiplasma sp.]HRX08135.1 shikimate kinase [Candidatus Limiplasma sp.]